MGGQPQVAWRGTNLARIGEFNEAVLIDAIRRAPDGLSRVDLVGLSGLSAQTISNIVRRMIDTGLVLEGERLRGAAGKPRTLLRLNPAGAYAIGVHLDTAITTFVLLDLRGAVVAHSRRLTRSGASPDSILAEVDDAIGALIATARVDRARIIGIGFASPGPIDIAEGVVVDPPHLPVWHNVPLKEHLSRVTGLPVLLDKDVVAAVVGERWAGASLGYRSSVFLYLSTGIGTGVIADDQVLRGSTGNAGDIGHLVVAPDGLPCTCGSRGCLGITLSPSGIAAQAIVEGALPSDTPVGDAAAIDDALDLLAARNAEGAVRARDVLAESAEHLARGLSALANLFDTEMVILGGPTWARFASVWLEPVRDAVRDRLVRGSLGRFVVTSTALGDDVGAIGAASLVLDQAYSPRPAAFVLS